MHGFYAVVLYSIHLLQDYDFIICHGECPASPVISRTHVNASSLDWYKSPVWHAIKLPTSPESHQIPSHAIHAPIALKFFFRSWLICIACELALNQKTIHLSRSHSSVVLSSPNLKGELIISSSVYLNISVLRIMYPFVL